MVWRRWVDPTPSMRLAPRQAKVANLIEAMDWVWSRHRDRFHDLTNWTWGNTPLVIVSDLIWDERQWADFAQLKRRQQIRLVHVALREEIHWTNPPEYVEDCETGARLRIDSDPEAIQAAQRHYWAKVQQAVKGLPLARATVGESDLTALEGVIWS